MTTQTQLEIANDTSPQDAIRRCIIEPARYSWRQAVLVLVLFLILAIAYLPPFRTDAADSFWNWTDPVAGIMALVLSIVVLYNQARDRWENSLEKRMTVSFVNANDDVELARVENAYLPGESDIRQWSQQLGRQIFGRNLQLDMNWDEQSPVRIARGLAVNKTAYVKVYGVTMHVYFDEVPREQLNAFTNRRFRHSCVVGSGDELPVRWIRCDARQGISQDGETHEKQEAAP